MKSILNLTLAGMLALLMSAPAFAVQNTYQQTANVNGRMSTQGRVTSMVRQGNQYLVTLDNGGYSYYVPMTIANNANLRVGEVVSLSGYGTASGMNVDLISAANRPYSNASTYGVGTMSAVVQSANRHLNYLNVRNEATGQRLKVDVRHMDTRRSVNVWHLRPGDRIVVNGGWENRTTFDAQTVNF